MELDLNNFNTTLFDSKLTNFNDLSVAVYQFQLQNNPVLADYYQRLTGKSHLSRFDEILFLPIDFFKTHQVASGVFETETIFTSSSTTGSIPSKHYVKRLDQYLEVCVKGFTDCYGSPEDYCILALLPSYLERSGSSLVAMADELIRLSGHPMSGFYLNDFDRLADTLASLKQHQQKTLLLGVTFALLDFAGEFPMNFPELIVMETGGMKGRKEEMIREEVHRQLKKGFGVDSIHSEYGMTELFSQAYSKGEGKFHTPAWMKATISDPTDPFTLLPPGRSGLINIIDLANIHSCAFIQTSDLGRINEDGSLEVLGRLDNSDIRGCSLMYS